MRRAFARKASALALILATALAWSSATQAASSRVRRVKPQKPAAAAPAPAPSSEPVPYKSQLLRLSQIIGTLAYLRDLCGEGDGDVWRAKMTSLIRAAGDTPLQRERMAGAYNKGFRDYELMYRSCTPNARIVISRYLDEGETLTRNVASSYGSG